MKNKKGETLFETMVAITILAIITVPLLHPFVTSSKVNRKARLVQDATTYTKNQIEYIKSTNIANFSKSTDCTEYIKANTTTFRAVDKDTSSIVVETDEFGTENKLFVGQSAENYYFVKKNVDIGETNADILIEYTKDVEAGISKIYSMNRSDCAYFSENSDTANRAADYFKTKNDECFNLGKTRFHLSKDEAAEKMTKTVTVDIEKSESYGNITVTVTYLYDIGDVYTSADDRYFEEQMVVYDNFASDVDLSAVYIYYFPLYGFSTTGKDNFIINNLSNLNLDIFLIAMNNSGTNSITTSNYKASLYVNEKTVLNVSKLFASIHSNIENIKWNKSTSNALVNNTHWQVTDLGNPITQQLSYNLKVTVYKHNDSAFYVKSGKSYFKPNTKDSICSMTTSVLDNSLKEATR